jgi:signal transduction histidine kinase
MPTREQPERSLASLLVSLMQAREQDGARVSRILHDEVGQTLSAIGLQLDLLRMDLGDSLPEASRRILEIQKIIEGAVARVRELSYQLDPAIVERSGLEDALERLAGRHRKGFPGTIRLVFDPVVRLPIEAATAMYSVAEQALANAVRHAGARRVEVRLVPSRLGATLEVQDDGAGFEQEGEAAHARRLGLRLMRYYARRAGLRLSIASAPEQGTIVRAIYRAAKSRGDPSAV